MRRVEAGAGPHHLVAQRQQGPEWEPRTVELWLDRDTLRIVRVELSWPGHPHDGHGSRLPHDPVQEIPRLDEHPPPARLVLEFEEERRFSDDWFRAATHDQD